MQSGNDLMLASDVEASDREQQDRENALQHILDQAGDFLDQADRVLDGLDEYEDDLLSKSLLRGCSDLANAVGGIADQLDQQSHEERRSLVKACIADIQEQGLLANQLNADSTPNPLLSSSDGTENIGSASVMVGFSEMDENDLIRAMEVVKDFLRDVETSLRMVDQDSAEELADVALTVARLFVVSLQSVHSQISPADILERAQRAQPHMDIELLEDDEEEETGRFEKANEKRKRNEKEQKMRRSKGRSDRLRVLWPPLGPHVANCLEWANDEANKRPILAVALGFVLWPAAIMTAFVGTPIVIADGFLQDFYNNFQNVPPIVGIERAAAHMYQTGRLALLSGKLVGRQTLFVVKRQIERHGGVGEVAHKCLGMAIDRATHPVETIQMTWDGIAWGSEHIRRFLDELQDQERQDSVQAMQL
mmetsp:Transcript_4157/g.5449  ORF Transcript_4157/g.5449 Transcript_4157/m.5449 type:complete len:422 (+) Transcript_4157:65-1330(+)|eukprot:CAMPEP_0198143808 /NCGR_PEP_ID=MMETSP1443-20131203/10440_1 /TAXON_ID=186043 /ORGANISM="Entomoneis sp., Strain CCMP2396" /LENGTH=421 /DNA_ID=CAMNT_0043807095 /DNA_START=17 /DNA_END=1282 /DNA_ORIENTATION=+